VSNLMDLLAKPPEVLAGDAPLHKVSKPRSGGPAMFATRSRLGGRRAGGEVLPWVGEHDFLT
jgi:hypothetical protein